MKPSAKIAAELIIEKFWKPRKLPVDPIFIAKQLGIRVLKSNLPKNVSGALMKKSGEDPIILLHAEDSDNRKRFTCAHELGHFYRRAGEDSYEWIDLRDKFLSSSATDEEEIFANEFAANLLMPEVDVRETTSRMNKFELLDHFGISGEAMKFRMTNLNISHDEF